MNDTEFEIKYIKAKLEAFRSVLEDFRTCIKESRDVPIADLSGLLTAEELQYAKNSAMGLLEGVVTLIEQREQAWIKRLADKTGRGASQIN